MGGASKAVKSRKAAWRTWVSEDKSGRLTGGGGKVAREKWKRHSAEREHRKSHNPDSISA